MEEIQKWDDEKPTRDKDNISCLEKYDEAYKSFQKRCIVTSIFFPVTVVLLVSLTHHLLVVE